MTKPLVLALAAVLLGACAPLRSTVEDAYAPAPVTCADIGAEMASLSQRITHVERLRVVERGAAGAGIGAAAVAGTPLAGLAASAVANIAAENLIDIGPERERLKFLAYARMVRREVQAGVMRLAGALRLDLAPGDCL